LEHSASGFCGAVVVAKNWKKVNASRLGSVHGVALFEPIGDRGGDRLHGHATLNKLSKEEELSGRASGES
jgi:hypothetical protein